MIRRSQVRAIHPWLAMLLIASLALPAMLAAQALEATFADLKGEVEWSPAGSTQWQAASANTVLHASDRIRTTANSSARLAFYEGSTTDLGAATGVRIDDMSQGTDQNVVKLSQTQGITQAQVSQQGATPTNFQVETPASLASAPTATCPWVRVAGDGTTLVRNYGGGRAPAPQPQPVRQVTFTQVLVPGLFGPVPVPVPQLITVMMDFPVPQTPDEQPLIACTAAGQAVAPDADLLSSATMPLLGNARLLATTDGRLAGPADENSRAAPTDQSAATLLAPQAGPLPQLGGCGPIQVTNTSGATAQTVSVPCGNETQIRPGDVPSAPAPIGTAAAAAAASAASAAAQAQAQTAGAAAQQAGAAASAQSSAAAASSALGGLAAAQAASVFNRPPIITQPQPTVQTVQTVIAPTATTLPCGVQTNSGGAGVTVNTHQLGQTSGQFLFAFNAFSEPDQFQIFYGPQSAGNSIFNSGFVSGASQATVSFGPGQFSFVTVVVTGTPGSTTTVWTYTVNCPTTATSTTATPSSTPTSTATPTRTATPTATGTATPTVPPISLGCVFPNAANCSATLAPSGGPPPMNGQITAVACTFGAAASPCLNFSVAATGFTVTTATAGVPVGRPNSSVLFNIPVVSANGASAGSVALNCPTNAAGNALCPSTTFTGVFPQAVAGVTAN